MMEYTGKYWNMLMPLIKKSLNRRYGRAYTKELIRKTDAEYRDMLNRADDIGKDNPMASNTYECLIFLAVWKAADGKISVDDLRAISRDVLGTPFLKVMGLFINANKKSGLKRIQGMMEKMRRDWKRTRSIKRIPGISILTKTDTGMDFTIISRNVRSIPLQGGRDIWRCFRSCAILIL